MQISSHEHIRAYKFPEFSHWAWVALDRDGQLPQNPAAAIYKGPGQWLSSSEAALVDGLTLFPAEDIEGSDDQVFLPLRDMKSFRKLRFLDVPADGLPYTDVKHVAENLEYLRVSPARATAAHDAGVRKQLRFVECSFPKLRSLYLSYPPGCYANFDPERFPKLEWVELDLQLDKTAKSLKHFVDLPTMQGMALNGVYKKDVLNDLNRSLIALEFWDVKTKALDFSYLQEFRNLRYLRIVARTTFDARILADLPELEELELESFKTLENVEALLDSKSLKRVAVRFIDQGGVNDALRPAFESRFEYFAAGI